MQTRNSIILLKKLLSKMKILKYKNLSCDLIKKDISIIIKFNELLEKDRTS